MDQDETYGHGEPPLDAESCAWGDCLAKGERPVCADCKHEAMRCLMAALVTEKAIEKRSVP